MSSRRKIKWKKDTVFSLKMRNGRYAFLQMLLLNGHVAVFDFFSDENQIPEIEVRAGRMLFKSIVIDNVIKQSEISCHSDVGFVPDLVPDATRIDIGTGFRFLTLWKGTPDEIEFTMMGTGQNQLRTEAHKNKTVVEEYSACTESDIDKYELTNLSTYPCFNERLYLCDLLGRNYDPLKELAFNRPLPIACKPYIEFASSKAKPGDYGYFLGAKKTGTGPIN